jgi:hypothetical protein
MLNGAKGTGLQGVPQTLLAEACGEGLSDKPSGSAVTNNKPSEEDPLEIAVSII